MKHLILDRPIAFIDVETTGLNPYSDRHASPANINEYKRKVTKLKLGQAIQGVSKGRKSFRRKRDQNSSRIEASNAN